MKRRIIVRSAAKAELAVAFRWYEDQQVGLGQDFVTCVDACIASISRNPLTYPRVDGRTRRALVRRFPYGVFYTEKGDAIVVLAVFHGSRDPTQWRHRR